MLSVCMIVKNEESVLRLTLPQIVGLVREVIVVDTGSTDRTVEVAESLGARVFSFSWVDDFAAARNYSLSFATQPWILWLDADEYLSKEELEKLIKTLESADSEVKAFEVLIIESPWGETRGGTGYHRVKVFRNDCGIHFERPINEQLVDASGRFVAGEKTEITIYHWGKNLSEDKMENKRKRYFKMYKDFLEKNPYDPYVWYLYGNLLSEEERFHEAIECYRQVWENGSALKVGLEALMKKSELELRLKMCKEALADAKEVLARDPMNAGARNTLAKILLGAKKEEVAIELLEDMLAKSSFGVDRIREQIVPRIVLSEAYRQKGDFKKAEVYAQEARRLEEELGVNPTK